MKHAPIPAFSDPFGLGQETCARLRAEGAQKEMARHHLDAFTLRTVTPEWRAMKRELYYAALAEYRRAKAFLSMEIAR